MICRPVFVLAFLVLAAFGFAAKPESTGPDPDVILKDLYQAHNADKGPFADKQNRTLLEQYFTKELTELIVKDAIAADGEVGALEFDPLYESQDPQITEFKIGPVNWDGITKPEGDKPADGAAMVEVTFKDSGTERHLTFRFQQDAAKAWKIADINFSDGSTIAGILRGDGVEPAASEAPTPEKQ